MVQLAICFPARQITIDYRIDTRNLHVMIGLDNTTCTHINYDHIFHPLSQLAKLYSKTKHFFLCSQLAILQQTACIQLYKLCKYFKFHIIGSQLYIYRQEIHITYIVLNKCIFCTYKLSLIFLYLHAQSLSSRVHNIRVGTPCSNIVNSCYHCNGKLTTNICMQLYSQFHVFNLNSYTVANYKICRHSFVISTSILCYLFHVRIS